jgi:hypothetical protein
LLHSSNLVTLAPILKVGHFGIYRDLWLTEQGSDVEDDEEDSGIASTGAWKPQPHFVWNIILDKYFTSSSSSESAKRAPFQDFFRVIVDGKSFTVAMYRPADPTQNRYSLTRPPRSESTGDFRSSSCLSPYSPPSFCHRSSRQTLCDHGSTIFRRRTDTYTRRLCRSPKLYRALSSRTQPSALPFYRSWSASMVDPTLTRSLRPSLSKRS